MIDPDSLHEWFVDGVSTRLDQVLLCLLALDAPASTAEVRSLLSDSGVSGVKKWNVSNILARSKGAAVNKKGAWVITNVGRAKLTGVGVPVDDAHIAKVKSSLRSHLAKITNPDYRDFVQEAIVSFEINNYRSAVVLSWVGAVALLKDEIVSKYLAAFNAEAVKRKSKWKTAVNSDDLGKLSEFEILEICEAISMIGNNVKQALHAQLKVRNSCGHPNSYKLAAHSVASHIEVIILNVYARY